MERESGRGREKQRKQEYIKYILARFFFAHSNSKVTAKALREGKGMGW
jgi:hypothetical protein